MTTDDIRPDFHRAGISILSMPANDIVAFIKDDLAKLRKPSSDFHNSLCRQLTTIDKENVQDSIAVLTALLKYKHLTEEAELLLANSDNKEIQKLMFSRRSSLLFYRDYFG